MEKLETGDRTRGRARLLWDPASDEDAVPVGVDYAHEARTGGTAVRDVRLMCFWLGDEGEAQPAS